MPLADLRRERLALPLLRDERPELQVRELTRIVAERAGLAADSTADDLAEAGLDVAPGDPIRDRIGFREDPIPRPRRPSHRSRHDDRSAAADSEAPSRATALRAARRSSRSTPTSPAGSSASSSAASSARRASSGLVLGLSGGIDSALVAYLVAEAIGADRLLCVLMPYRTSSPASRADAEEVVRRLGAASELVDISPMVDAFFGGDPDGRHAAPPRATSWPASG